MNIKGGTDHAQDDIHSYKLGSYFSSCVFWARTAIIYKRADSPTIAPLHIYNKWTLKIIFKVHY